MKILIAEDDSTQRLLLESTLTAWGHDVTTCSDGMDALGHLLVGRTVDVGVLDWMMPGRTGLEVCRALRTEADLQLRQVPVVLLTSRAEEEDIAAGFAAGATDYLTKPFRPSHVRSRVRSWLLRSQDGPASTQYQPA
jgi:two-component system phosphate regulon response regulator PhoB